MKKFKLFLCTLVLGSTCIIALAQNPTFNYKLIAEQNNASATFNSQLKQGIEHYNKAVLIINSTSKDATVDVQKETKIKAAAEFKLALPFFKKAYETNQKDKTVLEGLCGISLGINDSVNFEKFKNEYNALK